MKAVIALGLILVSPGLAAAADLPSLPGFKGPADMETFDTKTVWQAIDGAAEMYLAYGFRQLTSVEYERKDLLLSVGVFEQATPLDAYAVFLKQQQKDAQLLSIGTVALVSAPSQCVVVKGAYYVKVDASRGQVTPALCQQVLPVFAKALPGDTALPKELSLLPTKGQVPGSVGYTKTSFLGLSDLKNVVHAKYETEGEKPYQLFLILPGTQVDALAGLSEKWVAVPKAQVKALSRKIPYQGDLVVATFPKGTFGIVGAKDMDTAMAILKAVGN
jgi:hypothetical protein